MLWFVFINLRHLHSWRFCQKARVRDYCDDSTSLTLPLVLAPLLLARSPIKTPVAKNLSLKVKFEPECTNWTWLSPIELTWTFNCIRLVQFFCESLIALFQKISIPFPRKVFYLEPPTPSGNSTLMPYFPLKKWAFETTLPLGSSINLPWGGYGYFVEPHLASDYWTQSNPIVLLSSINRKFYLVWLVTSGFMLLKL